MTDINQASEDELGKTVHVDICTGASGECVYVNDYRVKGGKPWGGGTVTKSIEIKTAELLRAIDSEIQNLIRTEKLKLLAEVRERVVGNILCTCGCNFRDGCR